MKTATLKDHYPKVEFFRIGILNDTNSVFDFVAGCLKEPSWGQIPSPAGNQSNYIAHANCLSTESPPHR
jgi:hypothetical protein